MNKLKRNFFRYSAILVIATSFSVLVGWIFDFDLLKTIFPTLVTMKLNTALCFLLIGISLLIHDKQQINKLTLFLVTVVFLIAFLSLLQYIFFLDFGIDELFVKDIGNPLKDAHKGRMSPQTAILFLIISLGLVFIKKKELHRFIDIFLFIAILICVAGFFGFIFHADKANFIPTFSQISLITVTLFFILCLGTFASPLLIYRSLTFEKKITLGVGFLIVCFFLLYYVFKESNRKIISSQNWIEHTEEIIVQSEKLLSLIRDVELKKRGFVITGNPAFLGTNNSKNEILSCLSIIKKLTKDNHSQQSRIEMLEVLINQEIDFTSRAIFLRKNEGFEEARDFTGTGKGKALMDSIEGIVKKIQFEEYGLLKNRKIINQISISRTNNLSFFFEVLIIISLITAYTIILKNFREKQKAQNLLHKSNERFSKIFNYSPVAMAISTVDNGEFRYTNDAFCQLTGYERANIIGKKSVDINIISWDEREKSVGNIKKNNGKIKDVELKINRANGELIDILFSADTLEIDNETCFVYACVNISERKKSEEKLKEANKELDSFTYSVSHDLRAPLRAIAGYTRILNEDYGDIIDSEGKRIMNVISNNAKKMGQLIDDLLSFSRLGRQKIVKVTIDMNNLVNLTKDDLIDFPDPKKIQIDIKNLINVTGDISMIKVLIFNLLSNAVKYSSKKEKIEIEVGSQYEDKNIIYYIKDNGAGFDMQYYDKLFGVFQRLHSSSEFEGTGVGLAIVQRIIKKHGGKVWAESKIDVGSTFYFSLPKV